MRHAHTCTAPLSGRGPSGGCSSKASTSSSTGAASNAQIPSLLFIVVGRDPVSALPLISVRDNGDRVVGYRMPPSTEDLYAAGTPPVSQLTARPALSMRVAFVRVGDQLRVAQAARHWVVSDHEGALGWLTWRAALNGQAHPVSRRVIRLPATGTLHVRTLLLSPHGDIKNIGGYVAADDPPPQN